MASLRKSLPPVNSLVTFEAAARHLNFTRAAEELNVTQVAVSRQVRVLEDDLGVLLFERQPRKLRLTEQGQRFHQSVAVSLRHVAQSADELRRMHKGPHLIVATTIAFASYWLLPRISNFRRTHPDIDVRLAASDPFLGEITAASHASIIYSNGLLPDHDGHILFREEIYPVCSPVYLERAGEIADAQDLLNHKLVHFDEFRQPPMNWNVWLDAAGVPGKTDIPGSRYQNYNSAMQTVLKGEGTILGWAHLCDELLENGELVRPIRETLVTDWAYYLCLPRNMEISAEADAFIDWITREAGQVDP